MTHPLETPIPSARKRMNRYARAAVLPMAIMSASFSAGVLAACSPCRGRCNPVPPRVPARQTPVRVRTRVRAKPVRQQESLCR